MRLSIAEFVQRFPEHEIAKHFLGRDASCATISSKTYSPNKTKSQKNTKVSSLESLLAQQLHFSGMPLCEREYKFHPDRRWRMDFAWPEQMLAVEVEGGVWNYGRHNRPQGFIADTEKYNAAASMGWTVLRFVGKQIRNGDALLQIENVMNSGSEKRSHKHVIQGER